MSRVATTPHVLVKADGRIAVMWLVDGADLDEAVGKYAAVKGMPASVRRIDRADLPTDWSFSDAWRDTGTAIAIDMASARDIHMNHIRRARDAALAELDVPFMRALETTDAQNQRDIGASKQALRDIPQAFDLTKAETLEALVALWPEDLPRG